MAIKSPRRLLYAYNYMELDKLYIQITIQTQITVSTAISKRKKRKS